jgi:PAS domain S-box-containing protein
MRRAPTKTKALQDDKFLNALADAYRLQEAIISATELSIMSTTTDGMITSFNRAAEKLLGYSSEDVIGRLNPVVFHDLHEIVDHSQKLSGELGMPVGPGFDCLVARVRQTREAERKEWTYIRKDGTTFPVVLSVTALHDHNDTIIGYAFIASDISEQRKAHEKLRDTERRFRLLAENVPGVIYLCRNDEDYSMIYLNDKVVEVTGYTKEEILTGKVTFGQILHPDDKDRVSQAINEALKENRNYRIEYRLRHRNGEWRWIEDHGGGVYEGEEQAWLEGFLSDITNRKKAEEELLRMSSENLHVFNNTLSLNAVASFEGKFIKLNPAWQKTLGWPLETLMSRPFTDFIHPDDLKRTSRAFELLKAGRDISNFESRYQCADGSYRWLLWAAASDPVNQVAFTSAVDITNRKTSEEDLLHQKANIESMMHKLREQNHQLDEFAHIISHNLRSPVGNIQALLSFLTPSSTIEDYRVIFEKLKNTSENLKETMNELMDTLRIKQNIRIAKSELRFKDILDKVVQSLEGNLIQCSASVTFDFNDAPTILYPKPYLESIFQNLLSNAIKYRSPERHLEVHFSTRNVDGRIELRVSDNGLGIDMQRYGDKLFGMHKTFHEHREARGVGLFLTKTQVETLGGEIFAESEVNVGTTFVIRF